MNNYKEIRGLPFVNFTLTEFAKWRHVLKLQKKKKFVAITLGDILQIVYYQLAIVNHDGALFFLEMYEKDNVQYRSQTSQTSQEYHQICFLKLLLHLNEDGHRPIRVWPKLLSRNYLRHFLNLAIQNYPPALYLIGEIESVTIKDKHIEAEVLDLLIRIERCMSLDGSDKYYTNNINKVIQTLCKSLECSASPIVTYCSHNLSGPPLDNFERSTLGILATRGITIFTETDPIPCNGSTLEEILMANILKLNPRIIAKFFETASRLKERHVTFFIKRKRPFLEMIDACIEIVYQYIIKGGDNVEIIGSYMNFFHVAYRDFGVNYKNICQSTLLKIYSSGLFYIYIERDEARFPWRSPTGILKEIPYIKQHIKLYTDTQLESCGSNIANLMDNYFWHREQYGSQVKYDIHKISMKLEFFMFMLNEVPIWWEAALCIIGYDTKYSEPQQRFLEVLCETFKQIKLRHCFNCRGISFEQHLDNLVDKSYQKLSNMVSDYADIFTDTNTLAKMDEIQNIINVFKQNDEKRCIIIRNFTNALSKMYDLGRECINRIKEHNNYRPDGKRYSSIKDDFNSKVAALTRTQNSLEEVCDS